MIYRFSDVELDTQKIELRRDGSAQKPGPRVYAFLRHLLEHRERVVSKDELLDVVWPDTVVSESAVQQCAAQVRRALGQERGSAPILEAVYGQGYRIAVPVTEVLDEPVAVSGASPSEYVVGRRAELLQLSGALERLDKGMGGLVLIAGPAGIGKTHLLREVAGMGERRGLVVRHGRCREQEETPPFWPFAQALADEWAEPRPGEEAVAELAARLAPLLGGDAFAAEGDGPARRRSVGARQQAFAHVRELLARIGERRPTLLLLDDMHRADAESLELLAALAPQLEKVGWLFVVAHRPASESSGARELLAQCAGLDSALAFELAPLTPAEVGELVKSTTGQEPAPATVAALHVRSGGNPFVTAQLIPFLDPARNFYPEPTVERLPSSVQEAVSRQIHDLTQETRDVLERASVLGRDAEVRVLANLCGRAPVELDRALDEARSVGLLEASPFGFEYVRFAHTLIVEVLYEKLSPRHAARLHGYAADAIEAGAGAPGSWLLEVARHRLEAIPVGDREEALESALRAARWSGDRLAFESAARLVDRVLALPEEGPGEAPLRADLELRSARLWQAAGDGLRASARAERGAEEARATGDFAMLARATLLYAGSWGDYVLGDRRAALFALCEDALAGLADRADEEAAGLRAQLRARRATQLLYHPDYAAVAAEAFEARAEASELEDRVPFGHALLASAMTAPLAQLEDAPGWAAQAAEIGDQHDDAELLCLGLHFEAVGRFRLGEFDAAYAVWERAAERAEETLMPCARYHPALVTGFLQIFRKWTLHRYDTFLAARDIGGRAFHLQAETLFSAQGLASHIQLGGTLDTFATLARGLVEAIPDVVSYRVALACIHRSREERPEMAEQVDVLAPLLLAEPPAEPNRLFWLSELAQMLVELERREEAAAAYGLLLPHADVVHLVDWGSRGGDPTHFALGHLAAFLGHSDDAIAHFEEAVAITERAGAELTTPRMRLGLGQALIDKATPASLRRARRELEAAHQYVSRMHMSPSVRVAHEQLARLGLSPPDES